MQKAAMFTDTGKLQNKFGVEPLASTILNPRNVPDEDALDIKMMPASAPLVIEFQIPPVGDDLIFLRKYSLNAPTFNPKAGQTKHPLIG